MILVCITAVLASKTMLFKSDNIKIKNYVSKEIPGLVKATSPLSKARILRNYVYSHSKVGSADRFNFPINFGLFLRAITGQDKVVCGGMSRLYYALLSIYQVPARMVFLATNRAVRGYVPNDVHATVEIKWKHHWVIEDPTFNVEWSENGRLLSYSQLYGSYNAHMKVASSSNGYPLIKGRTVGSYYLPYRELLSNRVYYKPFINEGSAGMLLSHYPPNKPEFWSVIGVKKLVYPANETQVIKKISFDRGLPKAWHLENSKASWHKASGGGIVLISANNSQYQLGSGNLFFKPGYYKLTVDGAVLRHKIELMVLDSKTGSFINNALFAAFQFKNKKQGMMELPFVVKGKSGVRIIISNASVYTKKGSKFLLKNIDIRSEKTQA